MAAEDQVQLASVQRMDVAPGDKVDVFQGSQIEFVFFREISVTSGTPDVRAYFNSRRASVPVLTGTRYRAPRGVSINLLAVKNRGASTVTVEVVYGLGAYEPPMSVGRVDRIVNPVTVVQPSDFNALAPGNIPVGSNTSRASGSGTYTVVSAANNTDGVLIRTAVAANNGSAGSGEVTMLEVNGETQMRAQGAAVNKHLHYPLFARAGQAVKVITDANTSFRMTYDKI